MTARSYLYVPGDQPEKLAKAGARGADAIIADLEDAVAFAAKAKARQITGHWLSQQGGTGPAIWVRINNDADLMPADIEAVAGARPVGIYVPKADDTAVIDRVAQLVDDALAAAGLPAGSIQLGALIETARGVQNADRIAVHPRITELAIGEADLGAELGVRQSADGREWLAIRSRLLVACSAAGIVPPVGPVSVDFRDLDTLRAGTENLARMGFRSRQAIHPAQIPVINEVFTPKAEEVEGARTLIEDYERAAAAGHGVIVDADGRMVDEATVRRARMILSRARGSGGVDG